METNAETVDTVEGIRLELRRGLEFGQSIGPVAEATKRLTQVEVRQFMRRRAMDRLAQGLRRPGPIARFMERETQFGVELCRVRLPPQGFFNLGD